MPSLACRLVCDMCEMKVCVSQEGRKKNEDRDSLNSLISGVNRCRCVHRILLHMLRLYASTFARLIFMLNFMLHLQNSSIASDSKI